VEALFLSSRENNPKTPPKILKSYNGKKLKTPKKN